MSGNLTSERSASIESADNQNKIFAVSVLTGTAIQPVLDYARMISERLKVLVLVGHSSIAAELQCKEVIFYFSCSIYCIS